MNYEEPFMSEKKFFYEIFQFSEISKLNIYKTKDVLEHQNFLYRNPNTKGRLWLNKIYSLDI